MFDAHAHIGAFTDKALINTSSPEEASAADAYPFRCVGLIPESGSDNLFLFEEYLKKGFDAGEIGLDKRFDGKEHQIDLFRSALELSKQYDRLVTIHAVGYTDEIIKAIREIKPRRFIVHGFTGSLETAELITGLGGIISLGPRSLKSRDIRRLISLPFVAESDMRAGAESENALRMLISSLDQISRKDTEYWTEKYMKELLDV